MTQGRTYRGWRILKLPSGRYFAYRIEGDEFLNAVNLAMTKRRVDACNKYGAMS